jgi:hypothetical protein
MVRTDCDLIEYVLNSIEHEKDWTFCFDVLDGFWRVGTTTVGYVARTDAS